MERELRVLSGLHRGALLPLKHGEELTVGSDPKCDIVLVDQGVKPLELSVQLGPDGWQVDRFDGKGRPTETRSVPWGQPEVVGGVVLTVVDTSDAWFFVSAEEVSHKQASLPRASGQQTPATHQEKAGSTPSWVKKMGSKPPKVRRKLTQRLLVMGAVTLGFATYSISRTVSTTEETRPSAQMLRNESGRMASTSRQGFDALLSDPANQRAEAAETLNLKDRSSSTPERTESSPEKLRSMLVQRLRDAYLADKLELDLTDTAWNMRGVLDEEEGRLFGRILAAFYKEHNVRIPLHAYVNSAEEMLPFKIQQFSGGARGSVVTSDGERLYIGDSHKGYTLQRIDGRKIVFAGKRKVEVIW